MLNYSTSFVNKKCYGIKVEIVGPLCLNLFLFTVGGLENLTKFSFEGCIPDESCVDQKIDITLKKRRTDFGIQYKLWFIESILICNDFITLY